LTAVGPGDGRALRPRSRLTTRDLLTEALAGLVPRPGRVVLTALGTVLGVGAFVAVVGLTTTAGGQISRRFNALVATEVTVEDATGASDGMYANPFPADADARVRAIDGVSDAGVWWPVDDGDRHKVTGASVPGARPGPAVPVVAGSPGLLRALRPALREGRLYDEFHDARREQVVVLGPAAASGLGITTLAGSPAVFVDGNPFTVVGILDTVERQADLLFSVLVPRRTAEAVWGPPEPGRRPTMLVDTRLGAAGVVASQLAVALRPDEPEALRVNAPPDPRDLREQVSSDLWVLFVLLAAVCLVIGAVGIANTTMVAVLERVPEIGLRRALGARRGHISAQFLVESATIGSVGGLVGTSLGVIVVVGVAVLRDWTAVLPPSAVLPAPLIGTVVGVLAGVYPAVRAARIEPVEALRR
jgi:putative ABC transport system permease protein